MEPTLTYSLLHTSGRENRFHVHKMMKDEFSWVPNMLRRKQANERTRYYDIVPCTAWPHTEWNDRSHTHMPSVQVAPPWRSCSSTCFHGTNSPQRLNTGAGGRETEVRQGGCRDERKKMEVRVWVREREKRNGEGQRERVSGKPNLWADGAPQHSGKINLTGAASALTERQGWRSGGGATQGEEMEGRTAGRGWSKGSQ